MKEEKHKNKNYIKAGIWNVVGSFLVKGSGLLFSLYFASVLTQAEFGEVSTFTSYASILSVLVGLNLYSSLNNAKIEFAADYHGYQSAVMTFSLIGFVALSGVALVFLQPLARLLRMGRADVLLLLLYSMCLYLLLFFQAANITEYRYKENILLSCFNVFFGFGASCLLIQVVMPQDKITGKNLGATLPLLLIAVYAVFRTMSRGRRFVKLPYWRYALRIAAPNVAHILGQDVLSQSDRIFILQLCGAADAGVYSLVYNFGLCITLLWSGINGVWVPWLFARLATGDTQTIHKYSARYLWLFSAVTVLTCLAVPPFIKWLMPPSYAQGIGIVLPIILSGYFVCLYSFMVNLEFYHKKNGYMAIGTVAAAVVNLLLNGVFIPVFGYQAAAYTTLLSYALLFVFHYVAVTHVLKINLYNMRMFFWNILLTITACGGVNWLWSVLL